MEELERASSLIDRVKAEYHTHGMSDPECPGCIGLVHQSLVDAEQKGRDEMAAYYDSVPGVKNAREIWERTEVEEKNPTEELIILPDHLS